MTESKDELTAYERHRLSAVKAIADDDSYVFQGRVYYRVRGWVEDRA